MTKPKRGDVVEIFTPECKGCKAASMTVRGNILFGSEEDDLWVVRVEGKVPFYMIVTVEPETLMAISQDCGTAKEIQHMVQRDDDDSEDDEDGEEWKR